MKDLSNVLAIMTLSLSLIFITGGQASAGCGAEYVDGNYNNAYDCEYEVNYNAGVQGATTFTYVDPHTGKTVTVNGTTGYNPGLYDTGVQIKKGTEFVGYLTTYEAVPISPEYPTGIKEVKVPQYQDVYIPLMCPNGSRPSGTMCIGGSGPSVNAITAAGKSFADDVTAKVEGELNQLSQQVESQAIAYVSEQLGIDPSELADLMGGEISYSALESYASAAGIDLSAATGLSSETLEAFMNGEFDADSIKEFASVSGMDIGVFAGLSDDTINSLLSGEMDAEAYLELADVAGIDLQGLEQLDMATLDSLLNGELSQAELEALAADYGLDLEMLAELEGFEIDLDELGVDLGGLGDFADLGGYDLGGLGGGIDGWDFDLVELGPKWN